MKPKVYVTRRIPESGLKLLRDFAEVKLWEGELPPDRETLLNETREVDGVVSLLTDRIDKEFFDNATKLKVVSNYAVGYDNIDVNIATQRGVIVTNTPGILTETCADLTFALLMAVARRLKEADQFVRQGKWKTWDPMLMLGKDIYKATLGIIGLGRIGYAVAKRAKGFDMEIMYYDKIRNENAEKELEINYCDMDTLLAQSDFVTLHAPLTAETNKLINSKTLNLMKEGAILINTGRGGLVDEKALYEALITGKLAGAGLDVMDPEPPKMDNKLLELPNVIIVPHIASASTFTRGRMAEMVAENIIKALKGETPPNIINAEVLGSI